jgi:putative ABC transport system permease protein
MGSYPLILLRNFRREKLYTAINIVGLALGLASCLILGLFLKSELTYDRHYDGYENIYRIENEFTTAGKSEKMAIASDALGPMLAAEYPNLIKAFLRMRDNTNNVGGLAMRRVDQPDAVYYWTNSFYVDDNIFDVLPIKVLAGDPKTALKEGDTIAISETAAKKYFGSEDPMGKTLALDTGGVQRITLVFADLPANTHLKYDLLMGYSRPHLRLSDNPTARRTQLGGPQGKTYTYLVMHPSFKPAEWARMSDDFYKKYMADLLKTANIEWRSWLQPMRDVHLHSVVSYDRPTGNPAYLFGCAAVALIILVIASINYMNLATARATRRARSVGFRKILGASRVSLAMQFMGEALLFSLVALAVAVVIVQAVLKFTPINTLMDGKVVMDLMQEPQLALWLVVAALGIGLLSGLYPAFYLSSWAPLTALAGKQPAAKGSLHMRECLVLVQFTISAAAIACTLLMVAQMRYVANRPLGFESDNRLMVSLRGATTIDKIPSIRNALLADSSIKGVAVAAQTPADGDNASINIVQLENKDGVMEGQLINTLGIGEDYERVLGLKVTQGRDLSSRLLTDVGTNLLVNEALVKKMGWVEPLGKRVMDGRVVGVIGDFHFKSLKYRVEPLVIRRLNNDMSRVQENFKPFQTRQLILDVTGAEIGKTLSSVERVMAEADPRHPFEYRFLDEALKAQYKSELSLTKLIGIFAGVSIFIACMGLFGLAAFTTEQRSREIGTRKVLGATAWQIVALLARRILVLVMVAAVLASVGAYFAIDEWLAGFAYTAAINPLIFVLSALVAGAVAFTTVAAQSWRTANADPVNSLRQI